jgi:hypothetical protein
MNEGVSGWGAEWREEVRRGTVDENTDAQGARRCIHGSTWLLICVRILVLG